MQIYVSIDLGVWTYKGSKLVSSVRKRNDPYFCVYERYRGHMCTLTYSVSLMAAAGLTVECIGNLRDIPPLKVGMSDRSFRLRDGLRSGIHVCAR